MDIKGAINSGLLTKLSNGSSLVFPQYEHVGTDGVSTLFRGAPANIDVTSVCEGVGPTRMVREFEYDTGTDSLKLRSAPEHTVQSITNAICDPSIFILPIGTTIVATVPVMFTNPSDCRSMLIGQGFLSYHDIEVAAGAGMVARLMLGPIGGPYVTIQNGFFFGLGGGYHAPLILISPPLESSFNLGPGLTSSMEMRVEYEVFFGTVIYFGGCDFHTVYGWTL